MNRFIHLLLALSILILSSLSASESLPHVLVSVSPHKFFVNKVAGDTVTIDLMVPAGASAHTFEPTPKQMIAASQAELWFCVGESFEARASRALMAHNSKLKLIDLRQDVDMITTDPQSGACCRCHANSQDLHIWLSARQAIIQAETIRKALSQQYPQHAELYQTNFDAFKKELEELDHEITDILKSTKNRIIMVSHPAYAYFCRDYQLKQLSIEIEGKDPAPQQLNTILNQARAAHIKKVFIQPQYSSKGAKLFAKELGAEVITLNPYSEDYITSMLEIAHQFATDTQ